MGEIIAYNEKIIANGFGYFDFCRLVRIWGGTLKDMGRYARWRDPGYGEVRSPRRRCAALRGCANTCPARYIFKPSAKTVANHPDKPIHIVSAIIFANSFCNQIGKYSFLELIQIKMSFPRARIWGGTPNP